mmetsp:Transcript_6231/g.15371  ORF Transcript_6231/g.15371 Transcript_6231/m.15371 type:complete len:84 (-) Transcript_6231:351-602(-)
MCVCSVQCAVCSMQVCTCVCIAGEDTRQCRQGKAEKRGEKREGRGGERLPAASALRVPELQSAQSSTFKAPSGSMLRVVGLEV